MIQTQTMEAVYENGMLRLLEPLNGIEEKCKVKVTIEYENIITHPLAKFIGIITDEEADELKNIIETEFEKL